MFVKMEMKIAVAFKLPRVICNCMNIPPSPRTELEMINEISYGYEGVAYARCLHRANKTCYSHSKKVSTDARWSDDI